jgi:hypothetical protein
MGFTENKSDPCLLLKWTNDNVVLIGIYVDDCLVFGKDEEIQKVIKDLKTKSQGLLKLLCY